jgi:hypothetical protein
MFIFTCFILTLGIFHSVPIYLVFNSRRQENLLLVFWIFQELQNLKKGKVTCHGSQISRRIQRAEVGHQEVNMLQLRGHGTTCLLGRML